MAWDRSRPEQACQTGAQQRPCGRTLGREARAPRANAANCFAGPARPRQPGPPHPGWSKGRTGAHNARRPGVPALPSHSAAMRWRQTERGWANPPTASSGLLREGDRFDERGTGTQALVFGVVARGRSGGGTARLRAATTTPNDANTPPLQFPLRLWRLVLAARWPASQEPLPRSLCGRRAPAWSQARRGHRATQKAEQCDKHSRLKVLHHAFPVNIRRPSATHAVSTWPGGRNAAARFTAPQGHASSLRKNTRLNPSSSLRPVSVKPIRWYRAMFSCIFSFVKSVTAARPCARAASSA